jgi:hypothetical protein
MFDLTPINVTGESNFGVSGSPKLSGKQKEEANSKMTYFRLKYAIERALQAAGQRHEQRMVKERAGRRMPGGKAREVWSSMLEYKWYLRAQSDAGLLTPP